MMNLNKYGYYGEEPKPRFNTDFYTGDDKYSDGDIENEVIKIIAQNNDTDYAVSYTHLTLPTNSRV